MSTNRPYTYNVAEVLRVIAGDTLRLNLDLGFNCFRHVCVQLTGVETPPRSRYEYEGEIARAWTERWLALFAPEGLVFDCHGYGSGAQTHCIGMLTARESARCLNADVFNAGIARARTGSMAPNGIPWEPAELDRCRHATALAVKP